MKQLLLPLLLLGSLFARAQCPPLGATTFTVVNNAGNNVPGSFARACQCVNATGSSIKTIQFALGGSTIIQPSLQLSISANDVLVDGLSQSDVVLDGSSVAGAPASGLLLSGTGNTVRGLTIRNFQATAGGHGVRIDAPGNIVVNNTLHNNRNGVFSTTPATTALITLNSIFCNAVAGIDRAPGPNLPTIQANTQRLRGTAPANADVEVFLDDPAGCVAAPCQGKTLVGTTTANATGNWEIVLDPGDLGGGDQLVATSTVNGNNTSEFTDCVAVSDCSTFDVSLAKTDVACFNLANGTATATVTGGSPLAGVTFQWSNSPNTTAGISNLAPGDYTVTATNNFGCTSVESVTITQPLALSTTFAVQNVTCFNTATGSLTALPAGGTGPYSYAWSNGATTALNNNLPAGTYTVTITDDNSCNTTSNRQLTQAPQLTPGATAVPESAANANDGTVSANVGGGTPGYTYLWSNGAVTSQIMNLSPGTYTVTVTDNNGCSGSASATVNAGAGGGPCTALPVYAVLVPSQVCGNSILALEADDLYPSPNVQYVWFFPNGDSAVTAQPSLDLLVTSTDFSGEYFVLRDSLGCRSVAVGGAPVTVLSLDPAQVSAGTDSLLCAAAVVVLKALPPPAGTTGAWVSLGAATIDNPASIMTVGRNLQSGANAFVWQLSLGNCPAAASDTVVFFLEQRAQLRDDRYTIQRAQDIAVMEVLLNDALAGLPDTLVIQIGAPSIGELEYLEASRRFRYSVTEDFRGLVQFQYAVCSPASTCNFPCDTATVTIDIQNLPVVPEGLIVNDPGPNGRLTIKGLSGYSKVEMTIFNRWGDVVFQEEDYRNDAPWLGQYGGKSLPKGAYYYHLKVWQGNTPVGGTLTGIIHLFEQE